MHESHIILQGPSSNWNEIFGRHFVSMIVGYIELGEQKQAAFSAFIAKIRGDLYLLTAGHVIKALKDLEQRGCTINVWDLNDKFAGGKHDRALPIGADTAVWSYLYDAEDNAVADIAIRAFSPLLYSSLQTNGIEAIVLDGKTEIDGPISKLVLMGTPTEGNVFSKNYVRQSLTFIPFDLVDEEQIYPTLRSRKHRIIGKLPLDEFQEAALVDIDGMSGGPIFGIVFNEDQSQFDYMLVGVQSGWVAAAGQIAAWPLVRLLNAVDKTLGA